MQVTMNYPGRSELRQRSSGERILVLAPNLNRESVVFDASMTDSVGFREAISALHDVVVSDLRFQGIEKSAHNAWKLELRRREAAIRDTSKQQSEDMVREGLITGPSAELRRQHAAALKTYWSARSKMEARLRREDPILWRRMMPLDPVITVADDVVFFECFSADESSYGCLSIDRESQFCATGEVQLGTTNVDYSWQLYHSFLNLRSYRQTRLSIRADGFQVHPATCEQQHEETIELPGGWLRGFMQLQAAMTLPMTRVRLSVAAVYSLLTWLRRNRETSSPRAIRFELVDGRSPRLVLEPWETVVESSEAPFCGSVKAPIRIWGRRRLLSLARLLPLASAIDVYLTGTGLPSFWVVHMGAMRLTLGLSGWTASDWTRGSPIEMLLPQSDTGLNMIASAAAQLKSQRILSVARLASDLRISQSDVRAAMIQLAFRGQAFFDLHLQQLRWRQILPMELSDREIGPPHPEVAASQQFLASGKTRIEQQHAAPGGGLILVGKVENQPCEVLIDSDAIVRNGKCRCSWHFRTGIRNGPCRHLLALKLLHQKTITESTG
ncbi:MAG: metal-binding protein [Planctomycetota bacterium]